MRVIFLDFDGPLNGHRRHPNRYCGLDREALELVAGAVERADARVVVSSAWRYLVHNRSMRFAGFRAMLLTHGAPRELTDRLYGFTRMDASPAEPRALQIADWLAAAPGQNIRVEAAVAVDDLDLGMGRLPGVPAFCHLRTPPDRPLNSYDAAALVQALTHPDGTAGASFRYGVWWPSDRPGSDPLEWHDTREDAELAANNLTDRFRDCDRAGGRYEVRPAFVPPAPAATS